MSLRTTMNLQKHLKAFNVAPMSSRCATTTIFVRTIGRGSFSSNLDFGYDRHNAPLGAYAAVLPTIHESLTIQDAPSPQPQSVRQGTVVCSGME